MARGKGKMAKGGNKQNRFQESKLLSVSAERSAELAAVCPKRMARGKGKMANVGIKKIVFKKASCPLFRQSAPPNLQQFAQKEWQVARGKWQMWE